MTDFPLYDATTGTHNYTVRFDSPTSNMSDYTLSAPIWYFKGRSITTKRKRSFALPVAVGHAAFFLALALAGWLR